MKICKCPVLLMMLLFLIPSVYALDFTFTSALKTKPKTDQPGIPVTVQVMFKTTGGSAKNLKIIGGIDGAVLYSNVFPSIAKGTYTKASFPWTTVSGSHTAFIHIDPSGTSGDKNPGNNRIEAVFNIKGGTPPPPPPPPSGKLPNLKITDVKWTPPSFNNGDPVTFSVTVQNNGQINSNSTEINFLANGSHFETIPLPSLTPGGIKLITAKWPAKAGAMVEIIVDPHNAVKESNEGDNSWKQQINTISILPPGPVQVDEINLVISDVQYSPEPHKDGTLVSFNFKVHNKGTVKSPPTTAAIALKFKTLQNFNVPAIPPGGKHPISYNWNSACGAEIIITADSGHVIHESNEMDNAWNNKFTCMNVVQLVPGAGGGRNIGVPRHHTGQFALVKPNLIPWKVDWTPYNYKPGDQIKLTFRVKNIGDGTAGTVPTAIVKMDGVPIWQDTVGPPYQKLNKGEMSDLQTVLFNTDCGKPWKISVVVDSNSAIPETNETDNTWTGKFSKLCPNPSIPWVVVKKVSNSEIKYPSFDQRPGAPGTTCPVLIYYRVYNKSNVPIKDLWVHLYIDGKFVEKMPYWNIDPNADSLIHIHGWVRYGSYISVIADPEYKIKESNEADNTAIERVECK